MEHHKLNRTKIKSRSVGDLTHQVSLLSLSRDQEASCSDISLLTSFQTKTYVSRSKVMVIMKGLPGSGKSTIVNALSVAYLRSVVCSADKYFERNKKYKYSSTLLTAAHTYCQRTAIDAADRGETLIIIDNTNLQNWEMKFYVDLADKFNYVVIVVEPQTPWSKDVKVLAKKNSHGLDVTVLRQKMKSYEAVSPLFFAWFLNEADSHSITEIACDWLGKALQIAEFKDFIYKCCSIRSLPELLNYFSGGSYSLRDSRLLHCTSKYSAKEDQDSIEEYMKREAVLRQLGTMSSLVIVAFIITPNTYGARVVLSKDQVCVWSNDVNVVGSAGKKKKKRYYPPQKAANAVKVPPYSPNVKLLEKNSSLQRENQTIEQLISFPATEKGSKAHLTLGTVAGIPPCQTGIELVGLLEQKNDTTNATRYNVPGAVLINHGNNYWGIYPSSKIMVDALFSYQL